MRVIAALAAALLAACSNSPSKEEPGSSKQETVSKWVYSGEVDDGSTRYVDTNSIRRTGPIVRYQMRGDYVNQPDGFKQYIALKENNCATNQERSLQLTAHWVNGRTKTDTKVSEWLDIRTSDIMEVEHKIVCGK